MSTPSGDVPNMPENVVISDNEVTLNAAIAAEKKHHHPKPDIVPLTTKAYKGDLAPPGAYPHLKGLIFKVHNHLAQSEVTRAAFITVFDAVYEALCSKGQQIGNQHVPTDEEVSRALAENWPTYNLYWVQDDQPREEGLRWTQTRPYSEVSDTIYFLGNLVKLAEDAALNPNDAKISAQKLQMMIAMNIFRELMYMLMRIFFGPQAEITESINGKLFCLDWVLMEGRIMIQWDNEDDYPKMACASRVIFERKDLGRLYEIRDIDASTFINTLMTNQLRIPGNNPGFWNYAQYYLVWPFQGVCLSITESCGGTRLGIRFVPDIQTMESTL